MTTTSADSEGLSWRPQGLSGVLDRAVGSHRRASLLLVVVALIAFLPGFFQIPPIDRDEARFAQATKQMLERGDFVDIRFQDEVRYKKPVGIYWLQAAAVKAAESLGLERARTTIWVYRLPSLLGAIGGVLLTYWTALAFVSRRAALLAGLMMATSVLLGVEARLAKTDAMLLLAVLAAMGAMARAYLGARGERPAETGIAVPAIFWTALAAGILLKGPLILMFIGFAAVTVSIADRSLAWLKSLHPVVGVGWTAMLVLPWFVAIITRSGNSFFAESVGHDLLAKVVSSQESHGAPPGYYLLLACITFWPATVLIGPALPAVRRGWRDPRTLFLLGWLVPAWIVLELVVTKLPHYVLPLYPALAILIAGVLDRGALSQRPWLTRGTFWWFVYPAIVSIGAIAAAVIITGKLMFPAWPFAAAAAVFGLSAWRLYEAEGAERALLRACVASILTAIAVYAVVVPSLRPLFLSTELAAAVAAQNCTDPQVATVGYHEPSLVFLLGTSTRLTGGAGAAEFLRPGVCRFALVDSRDIRSFTQRAEALGLRYTQVDRVEGVNLGSARQIAIVVYRSGL